ECSVFPCEKYRNPSLVDSFISYRNVLSDFEKAQQIGIELYIAELKEKMDILEYLLENFNDGKSKNFYCIVVNLLDLDALRRIMKEITDHISNQDIPLTHKTDKIKSMLQEEASKNNIELKLRK
ncbi:MAG: DUF3795 domain-containing protein, partial [Bacillota bacterium]